MKKWIQNLASDIETGSRSEWSPLIRKGVVAMIDDYIERHLPCSPASPAPSDAHSAGQGGTKNDSFSSGTASPHSKPHAHGQPSASAVASGGEGWTARAKPKFDKLKNMYGIVSFTWVEFVEFIESALAEEKGKPIPPATCDGSGKMPPDGVYEGSRDKCPGCPACDKADIKANPDGSITLSPEIRGQLVTGLDRLPGVKTDGAEGVARKHIKIVEGYDGSRISILGFQFMNINDGPNLDMRREMFVKVFADFIRADREGTK